MFAAASGRVIGLFKITLVTPAEVSPEAAGAENQLWDVYCGLRASILGS